MTEGSRDLFVEEKVVEVGVGEGVVSASSGVGVDVRDYGGELVAADIVEEVVGVDEVEASVGGTQAAFDLAEAHEDDRGGARQQCVRWAELASACVQRKMCFVVVVFRRVVEFEGFA